MTRVLRIGYMPLTDAGLLFVAAAKKFDRDAGLIFELHAETSWANLRDKLAVGIYDAAHMLAPAVVASALRLDGFPAPMIGAVALGLDGNALSLAPALAAALAEKMQGDPADPAATARALAEVIAARKRSRKPLLRFAHVFPYSVHHYQLRLWLRLAKIDPGSVRLMVTPPPLMQASLAGGYVDGFCVGEPWNSLAQNSGAAKILHPSRALTQNCPEKVLAFRRDDALAAPEAARAAAAVVRRAALWAAQRENRDELCRLIAEKLDAGATAAMIAAALDAGWLRLDADATALSPAQALWLYTLIAAAGQTEASDAHAALTQDVFWPLDGEPPMPEAKAFGIAPFDPAQWRAVMEKLR